MYQETTSKHMKKPYLDFPTHFWATLIEEMSMRQMEFYSLIEIVNRLSPSCYFISRTAASCGNQDLSTTIFLLKS